MLVVSAWLLFYTCLLPSLAGRDGTTSIPDCMWAGMLVVSAWLLFYTCLLVPVQICMWNYADACIRHARII